MGQRDVFEQVQLRLYQAALGEASWADAANLIGEVGQTRGTALAFVTGRGKRDAEVFFTRLCLDGRLRKDLEREYWTKYYPHDESISRIARIPAGELVSTGDLYTDREKRTSIAYDARRHTGMQKGLNVRLNGPEGSHIFLSLADSTARGGEWGSDQIETITGILPHVRHFVRVRQSLSEAGALGRSLVGMLGNTRLGIIHLDRSGRIVEANDKARDVLARGRRAAGFRRTPDGSGALRERCVPAIAATGSAPARPSGVRGLAHDQAHRGHLATGRPDHSGASDGEVHHDAERRRAPDHRRPGGPGHDRPAVWWRRFWGSPRRRASSRPCWPPDTVCRRSLR